MRSICRIAITMSILIVFSGSNIFAENSRMSSDTVFLAIDLANVTISPFATNRVSAELMPGVEPSPFIMGQGGISNNHFIRIMTLHGQTGAQMGQRLQVELPGSDVPVDIVCARNFGASGVRGVDPVPWIVFANYKLYTFSLTHQQDGTPVMGAQAIYSPAVNPAIYGNAICAAELPGPEFTDGKARLFIGSDLGYIIVLAYTFVAGVVVDAILPLTSGPITDLEPIPQYAYIAMGALTDTVILGFRYTPDTSKGPATTGSIIPMFSLRDSRPVSPSHFDTFGPHDVRLADGKEKVHFVIANGASDLALFYIYGTQSGYTTPTLALDHHGAGIRSVVAGSLLMLPTDELSVQFDPDYSQDSGFSGCDVNITDTTSDICGYVCGDANGDGVLNIRDITYLINFLYKGGVAPNPIQAGDANGNGIVNIQDITHLINYLYKSGPNPLCP
jgi:Dockerin type I domain